MISAIRSMPIDNKSRSLPPIYTLSGSSSKSIHSLPSILNPVNQHEDDHNKLDKLSAVEAGQGHKSPAAPRTQIKQSPAGEYLANTASLQPAWTGPVAPATAASSNGESLTVDSNDSSAAPSNISSVENTPIRSFQSRPLTAVQEQRKIEFHSSGHHRPSLSLSSIPIRPPPPDHTPPISRRASDEGADLNNNNYSNHFGSILNTPYPNTFVPPEPPSPPLLRQGGPPPPPPPTCHPIQSQYQSAYGNRQYSVVVSPHTSNRMSIPHSVGPSPLGQSQQLDPPHQPLPPQQQPSHSIRPLPSQYIFQQDADLNARLADLQDTSSHIYYFTQTATRPDVMPSLDNLHTLLRRARTAAETFEYWYQRLYEYEQQTGQSQHHPPPPPPQFRSHSMPMPPHPPPAIIQQHARSVPNGYGTGYPPPQQQSMRGGHHHQLPSHLGSFMIPRVGFGSASTSGNFNKRTSIVDEVESSTVVAPATSGSGRRPSKKRIRQTSNEITTCRQCGSVETPEWRRGPDGARTLCNACGLYHAKLVKKRGEAAAAEILRQKREKQLINGSNSAGMNTTTSDEQKLEKSDTDEEKRY